MVTEKEHENVLQISRQSSSPVAICLNWDRVHYCRLLIK